MHMHLKIIPLRDIFNYIFLLRKKVKPFDIARLHNGGRKSTHT